MKKQRAVNRLLSVILAIIMVFELVPAGLVVHAMSPGLGSGTQEDPVVVKNFAELKEALESEEDLYIRVDEFENSEGKDYYELDSSEGYPIGSIPGYLLTCPIAVKTGYKKYLEINTVIDIRVKDVTTAGLVVNNGDFNVYGNGGIVFSVKAHYYGAFVLANGADGNMSFWGNVGIEGKNTSSNGSCLAIKAEYADKIDIRGGRFKGGVLIDSIRGQKATISGGNFEKNTAGSAALYIGNKSDLKLSGGTFQGIEMETGEEASDLSRFIGDCLYLINDEDLEDGTGKTKLEGEVKILNNNIPAVDVSVAIPYAGNTPADPVIVTEDVAVSAGTVKWERYDGTNWLAMGGDEAFIAGEKYRVSFIAEPTEGSGRSFSKKYPPTVRVNGDSTGVMPDPTGENDHYFILYSFTASPKYICSTNVNGEVPQAGATPKDAVSTTGHTAVTKTEWFKWDDTEIAWVKMQPTDIFETATYYRVVVTVAADEGYRISDNPEGRFNEDIEGEVTKVNEADCEYYTTFKVPGIYVDSVDISVTEPFDGEAPAEAVTTTEHVSVTETEWERISDSTVLKAGDTFEEGETYRLHVLMIADTGYDIATDAQLRINSSEPDSWKVYLDECYMTKDFTAGPSRTISEVDVNLALPVVGAWQEKAISATEHVSVTSTAWAYIDDAGKEVTLDPNQDFEAGKTYIVTVFAHADEGYTYSENPVMRINGSIKTTFIQKTAAYMALFRAEFTAEEKTLADLTITKAPDKTEYVAGEHFETTGMEVTATYSDNSSSVITGYTFSPNGPLTVADKEITVSYTAGDVTKTAKQAITVNGIKVKNLESIAVTKAPDKTTYNAGEFFDPTGMVVTAKYDDKSTEVVTAYTYEPTTALTASDTEITICYTDGDTKTASQPITVIDKNESLYVTFTDGDSFVYTGAKITPPVAVMYRGKALVEGVDYTVKYKNNVKASEGASKLPTVTVTGKTVAASGSRTFTITRKDIDDPDVTAAGITVAKGKTASPAVFYAGRKLGKNDINNPDAKVKFEADGTITIEGKGNFTGKRTIDVKVVDEKKIQVTAFNPAERIYNGLEQPLAASELTVVSGSTTLELGKDYEINYPADIRSAGTIKISVVGIGEYSGSVSRSYKISPCTTGINVDVAASVQYKAGGARPEVTVTNGAETLVAGRDYTLKYSNNKAVNGKKSPSVKVSFKGGYKGAAAVTKEFAITACDISTGTTKIYGDDKAYVKSGKYLKAPYVEVNGTLLTVKDMDVTYKIDGKDAKAGDKITDDMMAAGKVTVEVTVSGKGNYTGTVTGSYTISKAEKNQDISKAGVKLDKKSYAFTGENLRPVVTVQTGKGANAVTLKEGVDYKVEYFANINKGKATIVITGLGDSGTGTTKYYGSKKISFKIGKGTLNWL